MKTSSSGFQKYVSRCVGKMVRFNGKNLAINSEITGRGKLLKAAKCECPDCGCIQLSIKLDNTDVILLEPFEVTAEDDVLVVICVNDYPDCITTKGRANQVLKERQLKHFWSNRFNCDNDIERYKNRYYWHIRDATFVE